MERRLLAAILAAIARYQEEAQVSSQPSPWLLAGRREQLTHRHPRRWGRRGGYDFHQR